MWLLVFELKSLEEHSVLLSAEPSLQPQDKFLDSITNLVKGSHPQTDMTLFLLRVGKYSYKLFVACLKSSSKQPLNFISKGHFNLLRVIKYVNGGLYNSKHIRIM